MPDTRTSLLEAAQVLLQIAAGEPAREDLTGDELTALYKTIKYTKEIMLGYTVTKTVPELREGARGASADLQHAMWILESAWIERYSAVPLQNVTPLPLRRAG